MWYISVCHIYTVHVKLKHHCYQNDLYMKMNLYIGFMLKLGEIDENSQGIILYE